MSALRQKMIKTMELRNFAKNTQRGYLGAVKGLASYYHQSPDQLTKDAIEDYLLYLKNDKGNTIGSCGAVAAGLRFFYTHVLENPMNRESAISVEDPTLKNLSRGLEPLTERQNLGQRLAHDDSIATGDLQIMQKAGLHSLQVEGATGR